MSLEHGCLPYQEARHSCLATEAMAKVGRAMLSDRARAKVELADKNVGPTSKKSDAPEPMLQEHRFKNKSACE